MARGRGACFYDGIMGPKRMALPKMITLTGYQRGVTGISKKGEKTGLLPQNLPGKFSNEG